MLLKEQKQLTFNDVFLYQNPSDIKSRKECNINPKATKLNKLLSANTPFIASNMNAVSGKRMAEAMAIYGGLACLPQDMSFERKKEILSFLSNASTKLFTPVIVKDGEERVVVAYQLAMKKSINAVFVSNADEEIIGYYTKEDLDKIPESEVLSTQDFPCRPLEVVDNELFSVASLEKYYNQMLEKKTDFIVFKNAEENTYEVLTKKHATRFQDYFASLNENNTLDVILTYGVNQILREDNQYLDEMLYFINKYHVKQFIIDTAHGTQQSMVDALRKIRTELHKKLGLEKGVDDIILIAGNVSTAEGTRLLLDAGADAVKVGIWPWAMCSTRMQTAVGRPQFSAVMECAEEARKTGHWVMADGGIKYARDVCLALATWASYVMLGTILAGTLESVAEIKHDVNNKPYKQNYGMASWFAVQERNKTVSAFEQAKRMRYQEWISTSIIYLKPELMTVGDVIDNFSTGLQSSMSYVGARKLDEFAEKAVVGIQTSSGYTEGTPHGKIV